jgi:hypothetical protein
MSEETYTIESLLDANGILQEEVSRLRNSNRILRTVHRALRATLESQRSQLELAQFNDDTFKRFCSGEFDAAVTAAPEDNGLLEPGSQADSSV